MRCIHIFSFINYEELKEYPYDRQIAGQVHSLKRIHEHMLTLVPPEIIVRVRYEEMCEDPGNIVKQVRQRLRDAYGVDIGARLTPPRSFSFRSRPTVLDAEQKAVLAAMAKWSA